MSTDEITSFLINATNLLAERKYKEALVEYKKALAINSEHEEALKGAGLCSFNLKQHADSLNYFKNALKLKNNDATSLYYLASLSVLTGNPSAGITYSRQVIELRPDFYDAYKILFSLYVKMQKEQEIFDLYEIFKTNNVEPKDDTVCIVISTIYMMKKQYNEAIKFLKTALKYTPDKPQTYNNLGVCYMSLNDYDAAINYFQKSLEINDNNPLTYADLGAVYQLKGDMLSALEAFNKALELEPESFFNLLNVANLSHVLKRYDLAINAYEKMLKINPALKEIQTSLIGAYIKNKQPDKAINLIDLALKKTPRNVPLLFKKAKIYTEAGDFTAASKVYEQIVMFKKNSPAIYHAYAVLFTKMKNYDKALAYFNKAVGLDEKNALIHKDLGVIYLMRNQVEYAKDEFDKAIEFGEDDNEILKECADFYYSISDFIKADELYRKSLALEKNPYTSLSFGINLIALNKLDEAFAVLEALMTTFPENAELLYNLARIMYAKHDYEKAARLARKAYYQIPTIEIANLLGLSLKSLEDYKGAANIFDKILSEYSSNPFIYENLIACYEKLNDTENLIRIYYKEIENLIYDEGRIIKLATLLVKCNNADEAKNILGKANLDHPSEELKNMLNEIIKKKE